MCVNGAPGGTVQTGLESDIESLDDGVDAVKTGAQAVENASLALVAMSDKGCLLYTSPSPRD